MNGKLNPMTLKKKNVAINFKSYGYKVATTQQN